MQSESPNQSLTDVPDVTHRFYPAVEAGLRWTVLAVLTLGAPALPSPLQGQDAPSGGAVAQATSTIRGEVRDAESGELLPDVVLRLSDTQVSAVSDGAGRFVLRGIPVGTHSLEIAGPDRGTQRLSLAVNRGGEAFEVVLHLASDAVSMEVLDAVPAPGAVPDPVAVPVTETVLEVPPADPDRYAGTVVERARLIQLSGGARNIGELLARAVPLLRPQESDRLVDGDLCLEFGASGPVSLNQEPIGCRHPQVYLDGVILGDPALAYELTNVEGMEWIQAIPPGEAAAEFGGAPNGVILIATTGSRGTLFPRSTRRLSTSRTTFDWDQDPQGHPFLKTFLFSAAGTALGLAAGVEVGRQCIFVEDRTQELDSSCSQAGTAGVSLAAVALPALGAALGARIGGATDRSRGQLMPALLGAGLAIVPGYIYSLVTVGNGVDASNAAGKAFLLLGTPLVTTLADKLYRTLR